VEALRSAVEVGGSAGLGKHDTGHDICNGRFTKPRLVKKYEERDLTMLGLHSLSLYLQ